MLRVFFWYVCLFVCFTFDGFLLYYCRNPALGFLFVLCFIVYLVFITGCIVDFLPVYFLNSNIRFLVFSLFFFFCIVPHASRLTPQALYLLYTYIYIPILPSYSPPPPPLFPLNPLSSHLISSPFLSFPPRKPHPAPSPSRRLLFYCFVFG